MSGGLATSAPRVLPLRSPDGVRRLHGLGGDCVFSAPGERTVYELEGGSLHARPLLAMRSERAPAGRLAWLPFWRVRFDARVSGEGPGLTVVERVFREDAGFVRAFSLQNAHYVGDPGLGLTLAGPEAAAVEGPPPVCLGARLPSSEAVTIARLYLLEKADRAADVTGVRALTEVARLELVMIPFDRHQGWLELMVGPGTRFREGTVVDLAGIDAALREIAKERR